MTDPDPIAAIGKDSWRSLADLASTPEFQTFAAKELPGFASIYDGLGSTDVHAQAAILDLYSPDRLMSDKYPGVMEKKTPRRWDDFDRVARLLADKFSKNQGEGFYVLAEQVPSPTLRLIREHLKTTLPK